METSPSMVKDMIPEDSPFKDSFLLALASEKDDNIFEAKLKGTLEGSVFGAVADGLVFMAFGRRAAQKALKEGATPEQAIEQGLKATEAKAKEVEAINKASVEKEAQRWGDAHQTELEELTDLELKYGQQLDAMRAAGVSETDPKFVALSQTKDTVTRNIEELDEAISRGYYPNDARDYTASRSSSTS